MNVITKSGGNRFSGIGRLRVSAVQLERQQRAELHDVRHVRQDRHGHPDHRVRPAVRRLGRRSDQSRQSLVLRVAAPRRVGRRHQPHRGRSAAHQHVLPGRRRSSTTTARAGSRTSRSAASLGVNHDASALYQRDRLILDGDREYNYEPIHGAVHRRLALRRKDHLGVGAIA